MLVFLFIFFNFVLFIFFVDKYIFLVIVVICFCPFAIIIFCLFYSNNLIKSTITWTLRFFKKYIYITLIFYIKRPVMQSHLILKRCYKM